MRGTILRMLTSHIAQKPKPEFTQTAAISYNAIGKVLLGCILLLVTAQLTVMFLKYGLGRDHAFGLVPAFHMDGEMNVPSFASSLLLFSTAMMAFLTAAITQNGRSHKLPWITIGLVFILLSFDENIRIHERVTDLVRSALPGDILPYTGFEIPYLAVMAVLGLFMLPWFFNLDRPSQILFSISGVIFLSGAVGFEQIASLYYDINEAARSGEADMIGDIFVTIEETLEITGVGLFLYAMARRLGGIRLSPGEAVQTASPTMRDTSSA